MASKLSGLVSNPELILKLNKEDLVGLYWISEQFKEEIEAQIKTVKELLAEKIEGRGEIIGDSAVTKVRKTLYKPTMQQAEELGLVKIKKTIDTAQCKVLAEKGIDIPHETIEYVLIKLVEKKEKE